MHYAELVLFDSTAKNDGMMEERSNGPARKTFTEKVEINFCNSEYQYRFQFFRSQIGAVPTPSMFASKKNALKNVNPKKRSGKKSMLFLAL